MLLSKVIRLFLKNWNMAFPKLKKWKQCSGYHFNDWNAYFSSLCFKMSYILFFWLYWSNILWAQKPTLTTLHLLYFCKKILNLHDSKFNVFVTQFNVDLGVYHRLQTKAIQQFFFFKLIIEHKYYNSIQQVDFQWDTIEIASY